MRVLGYFTSAKSAVYHVVVDDTYNERHSLVKSPCGLWVNKQQLQADKPPGMRVCQSCAAFIGLGRRPQED